jgi:hypothetical protein
LMLLAVSPSQNSAITPTLPPPLHLSVQYLEYLYGKGTVGTSSTSPTVVTLSWIDFPHFKQINAGICLNV